MEVLSMTRRVALVLLALVLVPGSWSPVGAEPPRDKFQVVAYLPDYRVADLDPARAGPVTDLIFFSIEPKATGALDLTRLTAASLKKLQEIKKLHKNRLLITVGGWERSKGFAPLAASKEARARFAADLMRFCVENQFDGVDLDWEHPKDRTEEGNYAQLVAELKQVFQPKQLLLTLTLAAWQDPGVVAYQAMDRLHLMAYDHAEARHATLEQSQADLAVFLKRGVSPRKICLGLPFYGRGLKNHDQVLTYQELVRKHQPGPEIDEAAGVYFNGIRTIQRKTRLAMEKELGGVMVWELGQDATGENSLMRAIRQVLAR